MSDFGIICEMNPLHGGHRYLLESARARGADRIVCVMSGNTVQRGDFAVTDQYTRAEALLRCGADLVLELPFPWSSGSAESFARGGISILESFCDHLIFGSECGDTTRLRKAAETAGSPSFRADFLKALRLGEPAAQTYYRMLGEGLSSNDLLGIEYIRAAEELGAELEIHTVQRQGAGYADTEPIEGEYPSAAAIRRLWREGRVEEADRLLPEESAYVLQRARLAGRMLSETEAERLLLTFFRMTDPQSLSHICGCEGGLAGYLCASARQARGGAEFLALCRTKRYTDTHLRRVMLYCLAGVTKADLDTLPEYTTLLAANGRGRELLATKRKGGKIPVITKPADAPKESRQYRLAEKINSVYTMLTEIPQSADAMLQRGPYIQ